VRVGSQVPISPFSHMKNLLKEMEVEQHQEQSLLLENFVGTPGDKRDHDLIAKEQKNFDVELDFSKAKETKVDDSEEDVSSVDSLPDLLTPD
jgi:hypothetical protein